MVNTIKTITGKSFVLGFFIEARLVNFGGLIPQDRGRLLTDGLISINWVAESQELGGAVPKL